MLEELNVADIVILIVIGFACVRGLLRGLVRSVLSLATLVAALLAVWLFAGGFADALSGAIDQPLLRHALAAGMLFFGIMILGNWLLAKVLTSIVAVAGLTLVDRLLGGVFGIAWGALLAGLVLFLLQAFLGGSEVWTQSMLIPFALALVEWLIQPAGQVVI